MASRVKQKKSAKYRELLSIGILSLSAILLLGILTGDRYLGSLGRGIVEMLVQTSVGYPLVIVPLYLLGWGIALMLRRDLKRQALATLWGLGGMIFLAVLLSFTALTLDWSEETNFLWGGAFGRFLAGLMLEAVGIGGSIISFLTVGAMLVVYFLDVRFDSMIRGTAVGVSAAGGGARFVLSRTGHMLAGICGLGIAGMRQALRPLHRDEQPAVIEPADLVEEIPEKPLEMESEAVTAPASGWEDEPEPDDEAEFEFVDRMLADEYGEGYDPPEAGVEYQYPPIDLLNPPPNEGVRVSKEECMAKASVIEEKLADFGVKARVVKVTPGPVITLYEVNPAPGVKISRIENLRDDLALAMKAEGLRIMAPIPGKDVVGIEVPNRERETVYLRSVLHSEKFRNAESKLTVVLGKTIDGQVYTADIDKMPHLLIAGATGQGKSVCINVILTCILYRALPEEVQLVLVDPKRIELSLYKQLKHHHLLRCIGLDEDVITTTDNAKRVLRGLEREMDERYQILQNATAKDIGEFNRKVDQGKLRDLDMIKRLPYIVVVVDELADLMLTGGKEIEEPIARLAALSRAVGIHLVLATQRPSVDVITGVIKANFPARIAFKVTQRNDSRTILDKNGADKLLGNGDLLYLPPGQPPIRLQGAFITTDEIAEIVSHIHRQPRYEKPYLALPDVSSGGGDTGGGGGDERDALFQEAMKLVIRHQQGSASLLQRRLKVGYARASRLIDQLEMEGIVGPYDGSKARQVLYDETYLQTLEGNV